MAGSQPLYQQAAWASIFAPFLAIGLAVCLFIPMDVDRTRRNERPDRATGMVRGLAGIVITAVGFVFSVIGIVGAVKDRPIFLLPSLIGFVLNGGYLFMVIYSLIYIMQLVNQGTLRPG